MLRLEEGEDEHLGRIERRAHGGREALRKKRGMDGKMREEWAWTGRMKEGGRGHRREEGRSEGKIGEQAGER